ncbi:MAG: hypothetical protein HRT89_02770 [Lentisphaeria bacterium]|nr:hypothetical protein [Lentisphaeria bacterium]NQZ66972.1 hypothetical protein [Lentisphaeria bacterium]
MEKEDNHILNHIKGVKDWPSFFATIQEHPISMMGYGGKSINTLEGMMTGICWAQILHNVPEDECLSGFDWGGFDEWLIDKYKLEPDEYSGSHQLARDEADSDKKAFVLWMQWFDEFTSKR